MSFCIVRVAKLKTSAAISGSGGHNWREFLTPNADPSRTPLNRSIGAQSSSELLAAVQARLNTVSHVRKNGVLAIEYFIGASPEFFKLHPNNSRNYFDGAIKWLKNKHGAENVVAITEQYDETTPHLVAYVVPIDERGKLNAAGYFGGKKKLSELQTDFAIQCGEPFGLMRGIQGSKAKHIECSTYYSSVNAKTPSVITQIPDDRRPTFSENMMSAAGIDNDHAQLRKRREKAIAEREEEEKKRQIALENKARQFELERDNNRKRDRALAELRANYAEHLADLKANSAQLREIPLRDVLLHLGCRQDDPADPKNWSTRAGRLTLEGRKFYLHDVGSGGSGAIDLVKAVEEADYPGALRILSEAFGLDATVSHELARSKARVEQIVAAPAPFVPPAPSPQNWSKVRNYLTNIRKLAGDLIDELHKAGGVYADKFANAVFVFGGGRGVSLQSTADAFHCVRGETADFSVGDGTEEEIAFTESCINAISLRQLGFQGEIVATSGQSADSVRAKADLFRRAGFQIVAAFDDNKMMANAIKADRQIVPEGATWNADLVLKETASYEHAQKLGAPTQARNALEAAIAPQQPQTFRSPPRPGQ